MDEVVDRWPSRNTYTTQDLRESRDARIEQYRTYIERSNARTNGMDRLVRDICTKLPPAVAFVLFDHLVRACKWPLTGQDSRAVLGPPSIQSLTEQRLKTAVESLFVMLPRIVQVADTADPDFESKLTSKFLEDFARKALLTQHAISFPADFPPAAEPDKLPYPQFLVDKAASLHQFQFRHQSWR